jgi:hypothetical protein
LSVAATTLKKGRLALMALRGQRTVVFWYVIVVHEFGVMSGREQ